MAGEISPLLRDLAIILATAAVTTLVFHRLRQPVVLGYLLAGLVVGPYTPPFSFVSDPDTVRTLGDIGVIFLLFALGLEFNFRKLRKVGPTALISGTLQVALMIWLGYVVGRAFGLEPLGAIFLGAIVSISSTVIIVKVVSELRQQDDEWAQVVFGILIVEDVLAVLMLTLLSAAGGADALTVASVGTLLATFALFIAVALVLGLLLVPRFVAYVAKLRLDDVLVTTAVALGFGLAVLGGILGFSPALGAFLMGALIAESKAHKIVEDKIAPIRDLFTSIFFVTVGMLLDPALVARHWPLILAVTLAVVVGKIVAGSFSTFLTGRDVPTSLRVGFGLAQVGEFSFILAALAASTGATDAPLYAVSVSAAAVTAFTTPYLIRVAPRAAEGFARVAPRPVLTFASLHAAWMRDLRGMRAQHPARKAAMRGALRVGTYGSLTIGIVAFGGASVATIGDVVAARAGRQEAAIVLGWLAVGIVTLPFVLLYLRAQRQFAHALAQAAVPERLRASGVTTTPVTTILERAFFLGGVVVTSAVLLLFASPFVPTGPILAAVLVVVLLAGALLYRALSKFQTRIDRTIQDALGDGPPEAEVAQAAIADLVREKYPWAASTREVTLPPRPATTPLSIRRLHLRARTGASIVTIHRAGRPIYGPTPDTHLLPGDRLVLMGEDRQLDDAERVLLTEDAPPPEVEPPTLREVDVPAASPLAGKTLAALRLPDRVGVTILAIKRGATDLASPSPSFALQAGDRLVLLATVEQLARVEELARPA